MAFMKWVCEPAISVHGSWQKARGSPVKEEKVVNPPIEQQMFFAYIPIV